MKEVMVRAWEIAVEGVSTRLDIYDHLTSGMQSVAVSVFNSI